MWRDFCPPLSLTTSPSASSLIGHWALISCVRAPSPRVPWLLSSSDNYVKPRNEYAPLELILGSTGLVTIIDEKLHSEQRRKVSPAFSPTALSEMAEAQQIPAIEQWLSCLEEQVPQTETGKEARLSLGPKFDDLALQIICRSQFRSDRTTSLDCTTSRAKLSSTTSLKAT